MGRAWCSQNVSVLEVPPQLPGLQHPGGMLALPHRAPGLALCHCTPSHGAEGSKCSKPFLGVPLMPWVPAVSWTAEVLLSAAKPPVASRLHGFTAGRRQ